MKGNCETCAKKDTCTRATGAMFGFCSTDYEPKLIPIPCRYRNGTECTRTEEGCIFQAINGGCGITQRR